MRRLTHTFALLLVLALISFAAAQGPRITGIAYAHVSLSIQFGDGNAPTYQLEGSIFPRVEMEQICTQQKCVSGMATPFGYWYDPYHFANNPAYHAEEIQHIRQWEALGPAFLIAYLGTFGEPFEPYPTRNLVTIAANKPHNEWYRPENMWEPPADMQRSFPQFRIAWGGQQENPTATFMAGYADLGTNIIAAIQGNPTPQLGNETIIATTTPPTPYQIALEQLDGPDYLASNE